MAAKLCLETLTDLPDAVARPGYARADLSPGIVHVGIGNFHRAHQAVYLDALFSQGESHDWALVGAGVRPGDEEMRQRLAAQDYLATVVELAPAGHEARVTGAMIDFVEVAEGNGPLIKRMCAPEIRIVSLTVTEGGYYLDGDGNFDAAHPDMVHDGDAGAPQKSVFGAILAALKVRRDSGLAPFTVMSCDNIPGNGQVTKTTLTSLAALSDAGFADWVERNVACPNSMVDRITPATSEAGREHVAEAFGIDDAAPVLCEPFRQWVMEDNFPEGRPALEKVGVTFTPAVHAFETMKIRILNGGHAIIAYPAGLFGHHYVSDAMQDPLIRAFLAKVEREEVLPIVPPVPETDTSDYLDVIVERFANPDVGDTVARLCFDGSNRQPKFIVPSINDTLKTGGLPDGLILLSALWCRYCFGTTEAGETIPPNDPNWDALQTRARAAKDDPAEWLKMREVYGGLSSNAEFVARFTDHLTAIWEKGPKAVVTAYVEG